MIASLRSSASVQYGDTVYAVGGTEKIGAGNTSAAYEFRHGRDVYKFDTVGWKWVWMGEGARMQHYASYPTAFLIDADLLSECQ